MYYSTWPVHVRQIGFSGIEDLRWLSKTNLANCYDNDTLEQQEAAGSPSQEAFKNGLDKHLLGMIWACLTLPENRRMNWISISKPHMCTM